MPATPPSRPPTARRRTDTKKKEPWTPRERAVLDRLDSPWAVQMWLDETPYSIDPIYRCPRRVLKDRQAHCVDGALLAAAAMRRLGHPPLVTWTIAENDDGHLLALFRERGLWGAVGKSNFVTLRYREPVYRSLRELVMSYFEGYFNLDGMKSMRAYTRPLDLSKFDHLEWMTHDEGVAPVVDGALDRQRAYPVAPAAAIERLRRVDPLSYKAAMLGARPEGLFKPRKKR